MNKIIRKLSSKIKNIFDKCKQDLIRRSLFGLGVDLFIRDEFGNFIKLYKDNNFLFLKRNKYISDCYPMMKSLDKKIQGMDVVFDIGAHRGLVTMWLANKSKVVHSFEPEEYNRNCLIDNMELNNIKNVVINSTAVSNTTGNSDLFVHDASGHHSLSPVDHSKVKFKANVKLTTLDEYCKKNNIKYIDLLKIDTEGFEHEVLDGARGLLKKGSVGTIVFEVSKPVLIELNKNIDPVFKILTDNGYTVYNLQDEVIDMQLIQNTHFEDLYAKQLVSNN